jgi:hypothetical protein
LQAVEISIEVAYRNLFIKFSMASVVASGRAIDSYIKTHRILSPDNNFSIVGSFETKGQPVKYVAGMSARASYQMISDGTYVFANTTR